MFPGVLPRLAAKTFLTTSSIVPRNLSKIFGAATPALLNLLIILLVTSLTVSLAQLTATLPTSLIVPVISFQLMMLVRPTIIRIVPMPSTGIAIALYYFMTTKMRTDKSARRDRTLLNTKSDRALLFKTTLKRLNIARKERSRKIYYTFTHRFTNIYYRQPCLETRVLRRMMSNC